MMAKKVFLFNAEGPDAWSAFYDFQGNELCL